jgi:hypothetical protein
MEPAIDWIHKSNYKDEDVAETYRSPRTLHIIGCETREVPPVDFLEMVAQFPSDLSWSAQAWHQSLLGVKRRSSVSRNKVVIHNLCVGKKWGGLSQKVRSYLEFCTNFFASNDGTSKGSDVFLFADSDAIWSSVDVDNILRRYDRVRAGKDLVVVSSEMSCYAGHRCRQEDLQLFLSNPLITRIERPSYSSFINSGFWISSPAAALHMLRDIATHDAEEMKSMEYCDQRAMYGYWNRYPNNLLPDFMQILFGSLLSVANFHGTNLTKTMYGFTCELEFVPKSGQSQTNDAYDIVVRYSRGCDDVSAWAVHARWIDVRSDRNCSIIRSLVPAEAPSAVSGVLKYPQAAPLNSDFDSRYPWASVATELFRTVAPDPVVWHANGRKPKMLMAFLAKKWFSCRRALSF